MHVDWEVLQQHVIRRHLALLAYHQYKYEPGL
jgi:hypothetical protein